jgi:hypothetical protein
MVVDNTPTEGGDSPGQAGVAVRHPERGAALALLLILAAAAVVRFVNIGEQSLSIDEISDLRIAGGSVADILTFGDGFPPLYNLLLHFLLPFGDLAGRVLSSLCGLATIGVTWGWARRAAGVKTATCAAAIVALAPLAVHFSTEGRAYALTTLLTAGSLWALWIALDEPSTGNWVRWGVISALGVYTHYFFALAIAAWVAVLVIEKRGRVPRPMWLGMITLGVLAAPALALLPGDMRLQLGLEEAVGISPSAVLYAGYRLAAGFSLPPPPRELPIMDLAEAARQAWLWITLLLPALAFLLVQGYRSLDSTGRRIVALCGAGLAVETAVIHFTGVGFSIRYFPWLLIPFALWAAAGVVRIRPPWRWVPTVALLAVAVCSLVNRNLDPHYQVEDTRSVGTYLASSGALDYPVFVLGPDIVRPIMYYIDPVQALTLPDEWDPEIGRLGYYAAEGLPLSGIPILGDDFSLPDALALIEKETPPGTPYYLVYSRAPIWDTRGELLAALRDVDGLAVAKSSAGVDVYRGERAG